MGKVRVIEQGYAIDERIKTIDDETKGAIRRSYELEDELKLLRRALAKLAKELNVDLGEEFKSYNSLVESIVTLNKVRKTSINNASIKVKQKETTR